ncbi:MAG: STM3941 family protein [Rhabdochlamydiaceae bacterium]
MHFSSHPEMNHELIAYSRFVQFRRKRLLLYIAGSLFFLLTGFWIIATNGGGNMLKGWIVVCFSIPALIVFLLQLTWGPLLVINTQGIRIRSNPLLKSIVLSWQEIATLTLLEKGHSVYLGFALSPTHLENFLQHQPLLLRRFLRRRLNHLHFIALLSQRLFSCSLSSLLLSIQNEYQMQILQNGIIVEII